MEDDDPWVTLAANLAALFAAAKEGPRRGYPEGPLELEAKSDVGKSTIYRLLDPELRQPIGLDRLHHMAVALGHPVWVLLLPGLGPDGKPVGGAAAQLDRRAESMALDMIRGAQDERRKLKTKGSKGDRGVVEPHAARQAAKAKPRRGKAAAGRKRRRTSPTTPATQKR